MSFFKKLKALPEKELKTLASLCGGMALLALAALFISQGGLERLGNTVSLFNIGSSNVAATLYGTANFGFSNYGGYLHQTNCYAGAFGDAAYNNSTGQPACADGSWQVNGIPNYGVTMAEFSVRQTGTSPGRTGLLTYTAPYQVYSYPSPICNSYSKGGCAEWSCPDGAMLLDNGKYGVTCTLTTTVPSTTSVAYYGSNPLSFASGSSVTLEWSCQPSVHYVYTYCTGSFGCNSVESQQYNYIYQSSPTVVSAAGGANVSGGFTASTATFTPTANGTATLTCSGSAGSGIISIPYTVTAPPPPPTATINAGNGNSVAKTVTAGSAAFNIAATYTPGSGDTLAASAINGTDQVTSVPCANVFPLNASCWTQPDSTKVYTFNPTTAGTYTFYAAEKTGYYTTYNNYASVVVNVIAACPANCPGTHPSCVPNGGFSYNSGTNTCTPLTPGGSVTANPSSGPAPVTSSIVWGSTNVTANMCGVTRVDPAGTVSSFSAIGAGDTNPAGKSTGALSTAGTYTYTLACPAPYTSGNNGALAAGATMEPTGKIGQGITFGTSASVAALTSSISLSSGTWSVASWFKYPLASSADWNTLTRGSSADHQVLVQRSTNLLGTYNNGGNVFVSSGYSMAGLSAGWHHLVAVGSGASTVFYIDGVSVGTANFKSTSQISYIGNYQGGGQQFGTIDDVRIYNKALSVSEVSTLYNLGHITSGLVGYWPMDTVTTSGGVTYDSAGAGLFTQSATVTVSAAAALPTLGASSFFATPSRVRKGNSTILNWNVAGLSAGISCSISPALPLPTNSSWPGTGTTWTGMGPSIPITIPTRYTLTCSNATDTTSVSVTINLIPSVQEI